MMSQAEVEIYIPLLNEGSPAIRGTQALVLGHNVYKILPADDYNPDDEEWKFLPGTVVRAEITKILARTFCSLQRL